ncbi:Uma2 family endonuclease [Goodfellowiella coeruleoviolacea]|uniref:Endonuclease, Uma2 family (Restriction endonuclease fold) n=1 Tax=Goodfellowiella coeruleoviolacea TaxID=334858 RepID=A0AAE3GKK9_9PSEU|nr:Uma2 family endonuclease [Goodfellowiella coeruleoviolacea]MCP2169885.1 Endonuclease, Uma2 family (restriction endonuclease fold) [Goodfellowiella coeruleoviolacea]
MTTARRLDGYTLDDWEAVDPVEGHRVELVGGQFRVSAAPSVPHQRIADRLQNLLDDAVADDGMEAVTAVGVRVAPGIGYIPDVVVCTELVDTTTVDVGLVALVVEVVSPSTAKADRLEKPSAFAAAGVPAYWRVETGREGGPVVYCYRLDRGTYVETATLTPGTTATVDVAGTASITLDPASLIGPRRRRS